jgi:hypothetical protein
MRWRKAFRVRGGEWKCIQNCGQETLMEEINLGDLGVDWTISWSRFWGSNFGGCHLDSDGTRYKQLVDTVHECKIGVVYTVQSRCSWFRTFVIISFLFPLFRLFFLTAVYKSGWGHVTAKLASPLLLLHRSLSAQFRSLSLTKCDIFIIESPNVLYDCKSCLYFIRANFRAFLLLFRVIYTSTVFNFFDPNMHFTLKIDFDVRDSFSAPGASRTLRLYSTKYCA